LKFNPFRAPIRGKPEKYESDRKKKREADEMMKQARPMMKYMKYIRYMIPFMVIMFLLMILMFIPGSPLMNVFMKTMMKNVSIGDMFSDESGSLGSSLFDDPKLMKKVTQNIRMNPQFMEDLLKGNPELLNSMMDERMMENIMNADTVDGMISVMPPDVMNKMMSQMMSSNPEMMSDMMASMLRDNPDVLSSMFKNMDDGTMNMMFSTIFQDYDMVMEGGTMSMELPEATADIIGSKRVIVEITKPMAIGNMNFKVQKKAKS
jgi:hypothetical protein